jgi:oxygen-independent coproporphyrinogen-3 oxidase
VDGRPRRQLAAIRGFLFVLGLYCHIPFCSAICNYCNFNRGLFDPALKERYVDALIDEIRAGGSAPDGRPWLGRPADTVYFGGGTPSLLEPHEIGRIIQTCAASFVLSPDAEITLEANPESASLDRLAGFRSVGVNRVSFGVQSFRDSELVRLTRLHTAGRAAEAFAEARAAGFDNVSLDLMMWLPGQSPEDWLQSVEAAIGLQPDHASLYMLEVYPNSPLRDEMARRRWSQAPDEDVAEMYDAAMTRFEAAALVQYEISNVARHGRRSRHNLKYWTDGEWFGFGCGAHSTAGGWRWKNIAGTEDYVARIRSGQSPSMDARRLTSDERLGDAMFTGLRLNEGVDLAEIGARYDVDVWERFGGELTPFVNEGLLCHEGSRISLTRRGMLLAHEVMAVFV